MVTIDVDLSHLKNIGGQIPEVQKRGLELTSQDLISKLMRNSPVDHGLLKGWAVTSRSNDSYTIRSPADYAAAVNYGHRQTPGRFIPGTWKGDKFRYDRESKTGMVLKKSYVPGKHFVERSIEQVKPRIESHFKVAIREVLL